MQIQLKRAQNSLSVLGRMPPEILGGIFQFSAIAGHYKFLEVCHYWYEVARHNPGLWRYWGDSLEDWKRASVYSKTPLAIDLVLDRIIIEHRIKKEDPRLFDDNLQKALRDRVAANTIQKVHLMNRDEELMSSIILSLTPEGNAVRQSSIKSIHLAGSVVDLSEFFARNHFQQLQNLSLGHASLALAHLKATTLVNLSLAVRSFSELPTTPQIIPVLVSNRNIRTLKLSLTASDDSNNPEARRQIALPHLEELYLEGKAHHVLQFRSQLESSGSGTVKKTVLVLYNCTLETITTESIRPYLSGILQHDAGVGAGLKVRLNCYHSHRRITLCVSGAGTGGPDVCISMAREGGTQTKPFCINILRALPKERITDFETNFLEMEEMPNLRCLSLRNVVVSGGFLLSRPDGLNAHAKLFPSLRELHLPNVTAKDNNWDPLIHYLEHQSVSLHLKGHICTEVREKIEPLVEAFRYIPDQINKCNTCWRSVAAV